jgi:hypothetical protein
MIEILEKWKDAINETDHEIERFRNFFGVVECDLIDVFEKLQCKYTHAIAKQIGDTDAHWLLWFWLDNGMGTKELSAGYDGNINPVTGLNALEELITEGARRY